MIASVMRRFCAMPVRALSPQIKEFLASPRELYRLSPKFRDETSECSMANEIIELSEKAHRMRLKRMQLLSLPASSVTNRNRELISLAIGAVSGALSLSFHPAFSLIFIVSYRMYRNASKCSRERFEGAESAKTLHKDIQDTYIRINQLVAELENTGKTASK